MLVDYRKVNANTKNDSFPLPRIEDCLDRIGPAKFITKLDLLKGYWQVPLSDRAREISAFVTPFGLYECKVMPFGMKNAACTFQRLMNRVICGLEGTEIYVDDLVIHSNDWRTHLVRLKKVFEALRAAGLVVNLSKCEFGKAKVCYLGHEVGLGQVTPKQANLEALLTLDRRQSLGLDAINQLLEQFDSDVDDALEVDDISDEEFINVDELKQEVREEQEEQEVTQNPEMVALGNGDGEADDDVGEEEGVGASGSHVVPVSTITSPVPSTSRGPPPVTVPVPQLTPVEERSRKRRRGDLQAARGSAITHIDAESVKGRDGTVWHRDPNATLPHMFTPRIEPGGPTSLTLGTSKVSDIFSLFLTDRMLAEVVLYSNERLALLRSHYHHKGNVALRDIDLRELKAFIGILIMTAVRADNHTPTWDMWNLTEGNPLYRCTMNERRFTLLVRVIRFDDSATRQERVKVDRLAPIRKLFDHVVTNCRNNYTPGPHLTVDEQLVPFRGRCPFKMYIPNKPAKYGIKIVLACDADTHYMCNAIAYLGKDTVQIPRGSTLGEVFTSDLVAPFQRSGRTVTTDNFFTTLPLALSLLDKDMYLCGTIRQKPYIPKELTEKVLPPKESVAVFNYEHNLTLQCQQISRTKKVMLLSSLHHDPSEVEKKKTDIQMFYNATKGGVDTFDQMCSTSSCIRKSRRWPMTLFYGILNIIMVNSYILYTSMPFTKPVPKRTFLRDIAYELCAPQAIHRYLTSHSLSKGLRQIMVDTFKIPEQVPPRRRIPVGQRKLPKRIRCHSCPPRDDRKTNTACLLCKSPVCLDHQSVLCPNCSICPNYNAALFDVLD
ncbi:piggyBac transposable element-derived protein 4-like [Palaemon carinicauda]|uniref:piggyBac transposable element-derived protein 4-like n=1 Tax=Palaemon carinicauda TaxID=392227 RepID=UPI0035B62197